MTSQKVRDYVGAAVETKEMLDHPQVEAALQEAADRGVDIEVILHLNTSETIRRLIREGKIKGFYSPVPIKEGPTEGPYAVFDSDGVMATNSRGVTKYRTHTAVLGDFLSHVFGETKKETYPISPEKADAVFGMIQARNDPTDIVSYLTR